MHNTVMILQMPWVIEANYFVSIQMSVRQWCTSLCPNISDKIK